MHIEDPFTDDGFSLTELIVSAIILGILTSVSVPVIMGLQERAIQATAETLAGNITTDVAAQLAAEQAAQLPSPVDVQSPYEVNWKGSEPTAIDEICIVVSRTDGGHSVVKGPGC